jgi:carboxypeptidase Taq
VSLPSVSVAASGKTTALERLRTLIAGVMDLRHAADLIEWDERVYMPEGGAPVHGEMSATLRRLAHEQFTSTEVGAALAAARRELADADPDGDDARMVAVTERDFDKATRVPAAFVAEHAAVVSAAQHAWVAARAESSFAKFLPHLDRIIDLKQRYIGFFPAAAHPYDLHLDEFEPGMTTADVQRLFAALRPRQVALIRALGERPAPADGFLAAGYDEAAMLAFATDVITTFGFDWTRGRQDKSVHPFASAIGAGDVRITTRWVEGQPLSLLFGTMHETGHALYEQGVSPSHHRTLLEGGASLGIHESQSRLWENLVGRSRPFWQHFYPALQARFASQLRGVSVDGFHRAINRVRPTLIRVEADEATYNLHVMLRVELEIALLDGSVRTADLPEAWNARMQEYLGLTPPDDARGVLQDIHWSAGLFGYFATYTLGNVIAAQLWQRFGQVAPSREADLARGEFGPLLEWLRRELHQHGRKFQPQELVTRITGSPIDPEPYLQYLEAKYLRMDESTN